MASKEDGKWITWKGKHILLKEEQSDSISAASKQKDLKTVEDDIDRKNHQILKNIEIAKTLNELSLLKDMSFNNSNGDSNPSKVDIKKSDTKSSDDSIFDKSFTSEDLKSISNTVMADVKDVRETYGDEAADGAFNALKEVANDFDKVSLRNIKTAEDSDYDELRKSNNYAAYSDKRNEILLNADYFSDVDNLKNILKDIVK